MNVFVTGGTGTIGSAVVTELLAHDHRVLALARSDRSAEALEAAGAGVLRGDLSDVDVLLRGADATDGVVSLAFGRDYGDPAAIAASVTEEGVAVRTLGERLVGSGRPFAVVSGTPWIPGRVSTEADPIPTGEGLGERGTTVEWALALSERGVRSVSVRMPRTVHADGEGGFAGLLTDLARRTGVSAYPGDGTQRWPAVHAADAASLFRIALERAPGGSAWHAVGDEGDAVRDIAEVIGRRLGLPVEPRPVEHFGPFGPIFAMDQPSSSAYTQQQLGWRPVHAALLEDLENVQP
jgi:nucleoside-diphosphate-sugar epimerase